MNCKKTIKDLRELNSQLKSQYSDEQNRNYCLQCKIDKLEKEDQELIEYLKKKIKERNKDIKLIGEDVYTSKYAYQEILSKIEKG